MKVLTVTEAARNFSELVSRVHYRGETALLTKGGKEVARISPARRTATGRDLAEAWPGLRHLDDSEAADFARDIALAKRSLPALPAKWG